ncbi:RsiW-degrading membrane proteinase PrsW (M82 family) [Geomicrobium halophilum]|uniref:RsiW-degrading membrane proteinase PrsW (M82 family) n=1 Tax=Geomicrobium halophilum TaxID=549000 RepID=A0A841Q2T0_9BACL|nr:DUF3021 domain-containing protein [Geomicrobium halophilum]MBB6451378.1 RsiW-degrading membrane proteinase PrsW (M82 family) [Geomicrobium halophilum]
MLSEIVYRSFGGLGFACLITFIALTALMLQNIEVPIAEVWVHMLGSMILGVYFGVASFIFEIEKWSPLKQVIVHFFLSVTLWFLIAIFMAGWVPLTPLSIVISFCMFVGIYVLFWLGFNAYYKKIEADMNNSVR